MAGGLSEASFGLLMECRRKLAEHFSYADGKDLGSHTDGRVPLMPAHERYDGNLYRKIGNSAWTSLRACNAKTVLIVSALYGLVAPWEPIREYERCISDKVGGLRLARWWSQRGLGSFIVEYAKLTGAHIVHDFLSGAYARISEEFSSLKPKVKVERHEFRGRYSAADYYRGWEVQRLIAGSPDR